MRPSRVSVKGKAKRVRRWSVIAYVGPHYGDLMKNARWADCVVLPRRFWGKPVRVTITPLPRKVARRVKR